MATSSASAECSNTGCNNVSTMVCPTCRKLGAPPSFYCSKECFQADWSQHKNLHKLFKLSQKQAASRTPEKDVRFNNYRFTGPLRPAIVQPQRTVTGGIALPDYALTGVPASEQAMKQNRKIDKKSPAELEKLRAACRVSWLLIWDFFDRAQ
jgi:methionyl aminopeptidase